MHHLPRHVDRFVACQEHGRTYDVVRLTEPPLRDAIDQGLKNEMFSRIGEKGMRATIVTDDDNKKITEIRVGGGGKKKN